MNRICNIFIDVSNTGDQHVTGTKNFLDGLKFADDVTIEGVIDTVNITTMALDAVYKTGDFAGTADITEMKTFHVLTTFEDVIVNGE